MKAYKYDGAKTSEMALSDSAKSSASEYRNMLVEAVAETEEELMDKFFNGEEFTKEEMHHGIRKGIIDGVVVPVTCGSAFQNIGIQALMDTMVDLLPAPDAKPEIKGKKPGSDEAITRKVSSEEPLSALVFKTIADPYVGKISMFKIMSGTLKSDTSLLNSFNGKTEKVAQLFTMRGKKQVNLDKAAAGDIVAVAKLQFTNTGDTLCDPSKPIVLEGISFPEPAISMAIEPKAKGDEEKIGAGLHKLLEEDPTFKLENNAETHQLLI
jgi:elongation factor G